MADTKADIASWIRAEHSVVAKLVDDLRKVTAIVPRTCTKDWLDSLRTRFDHLRAHLTKHMALEEREGYMEAVLERRPTLSNRVERLEQEHRDIGFLLDELHDLTKSLEPHRLLLVRDVCLRINALVNYVEHHEAEENDLAEFVFTRDIGSKD